MAGALFSRKSYPPAMFKFFFCRKTGVKQIVICFQFPDNYPREPALIELKSKTLSQKLLHGLSQLMEGEAKKLIGQYQV